MRFLLKSAARVWTRRPAGPLLVALGVLAATLSAAGADLALAGAEQAERDADRAELGESLARVRTPGGYTVDEAELRSLQSDIVNASEARGPAEQRLPVYLSREATLTHASTTTSGWRILGLPQPTLDALGLPTPDEGTALVDPGPRASAPEEGLVRVQAAPREDVRLTQGFQGQLTQTARVGDGYQHDSEDTYVFEPNVTAGAKRLQVYLAQDGNDTDFDLEVTGPSGDTWLADNGTAAQPEQPNVTIADPEDGTWTIRVHAKFARNEAFRLQVVEVFDARDATAIGRLLQGEGFRAVGAQLGLTRLASLDLDLQPADMATLGPAPGGLIVLPLERLQTRLDLEDRATGLLVRAGPGEDPLQGLAGDQRRLLEEQVGRTREQAAGLDAAAGLALAADADRLAEDREQRLTSTGRLLFVALPAAVLAGVLLATWAAGLHTRRLTSETLVLAGLGQSRRRSWTLVALHLGPAFLLGAAGALALSPLAGEAIARGLGLATPTTPIPSLGTLATPALALVPVTGTVYGSLRRAVEGADPRTGRRPRTETRRCLGSGLGLAAGLGLLAWALAGAGPSGAYLAGAAGAACVAWALHWSPLWNRLLGQRTLAVDALGLFRTRSTHAALGLAGAVAALVIAALVAGVGLSQAAQPDVQAESGGYGVVAQTPANVNSYAELPATGDASSVLDRSVGAEFLMRVTGTNIHGASAGGEDTVYGIDSSFAQRHRHPVRSLDPAVDEPVRAVTDSRDKALVTTSLAERLEGEEIVVRGPQGELTYQVVGVLETRLLEGVYIAKDALPSHFNQIAGEQRVRLAEGVDADRYAEDLQTAYREQGLTASTAQTLADRQLDGQRRAGQTLQGVAAIGAATLVGLVGLLGFRARAERRSSDAVFAALGARPRSIALGIATETALPILVGAGVGLAITLPLAAGLADISGLAFPLTPVDVPSLVTVATASAIGTVLLSALVGSLVGYRAGREVDQGTLRQVD